MYQIAILLAGVYLLGLSILALAFSVVLGKFVSPVSYIYMGIVGIIFVIVSFGYVFRKHYLKNLSRMKTWLDLHVLTGTIGSVLILIHSEFHFRAVAPALALFFMLMVVVSGVIGQYLIAKISKKIAQEKAVQKAQDPMAEKGTRQENEDELMLLVFSVSIMKHWRKVHLHITPVLII